MAEIDELVVRITGDVSGLEGAVAHAQGALAGLTGAQNGSTAAVERGTRAAGDYARQTRNTAADLQSAGRQMKSLGEGIDSVTKPLQVASLALGAGGVAAAKFAIDFEDSFAGVKKTVDGTPEQLEEIRQGIIDLTTTGINGRNPVRATTTELNDLAAIAGQLGYKADEIVDFTEVMAQMQSATNLGGEEGAKTLARYMNVTQTAHDKTRNLGSAIVYLGNNYATTEAEIASMAMRLGRTGTLVGMSAADTLGYATALSSMGIEAEAGGTAVSKSWTKIDNAVATGGEALEKFSKVAGKSADEFSEQWKSDAAGAFNDFLGGLAQAENLPLALQDLGITEVREADALKALALGYETAKQAVKDANTAWQENTALQKEADEKANTTAGKLANLKNNVVEAGRSLGEVMLPTVVDVTGGIAKMTQGLAKMPDAGKKAIVTAGAVTVGIGALSKGAAGAIKTVGGVVEGIGKIKEVAAAGGAGAKLLSVAKGFGVVGASVAGAAAAIGVAKVAYDAWYKSQYKWAEGLSDGTAAIDESLNKYKTLSEIQKDLKQQRIIISNPASSQEQVETAKQRIQEIADLLKQEYNLKINVEDDGLDDAVDKAKDIAERDFAESFTDQVEKVSELSGKFEKAKKRLGKIGFDWTTADKSRDDLSNLENDFALLNAAWKNGKGDLFEYQSGLEDLGRKLGMTDSAIDEFLLNGGVAGLKNEVDKRLNTYGDDFDNLLEYIDESKAAVDSGIDYLGAAVENGDMSRMSTVLSGMGMLIRDAGLDMNTYAVSAAQAMSGNKSLTESYQEGGESLKQFIGNYRQAMTEFGASDQQITSGIAEMETQLNEFAHAQGLIQPNQTIRITAEGDLSVIDATMQELGQIDGKTVTAQINADGSPAAVAIDGVTAKIEKVDGQEHRFVITAQDGASYVVDIVDGKLQQVPEETSTTVNATEGDTSGLEAAEEAQTAAQNTGDVNSSINVTGTYTGKDDIAQAISDQGALTGTSANITAKGSYPGQDAIATALSHQASLQDKTVTYTVNYVQNGTPPKENATGTNYFSGGLAMVNDQRGISDPRELIVDRGRAFIPEGRDVILPLSKGAKVYTARQTKAIMSGLGIPRYAEGKKNSDAFTSARDNWTHYTKTHAVTTTQELEKWLELQQEFRDTDKDIEDIEEQIFSLRQKQTKELNDQSAAWIEERNALNDWADIGDDPIAAFNRVRERNMAEVEAGRMLWEDYTDTVSRLGKDMYDDRVRQSRDWLAHEEKYRFMSEQDYIAGLDRMAAYTEEYYANGLITYREYSEGLIEIAEERIDKERDLLDRLQDDSLAWFDDRTYFNDWQSVGDDPIAAFGRVKDRLDEALNDSKISFDEYNEYLSEAGNALYEGRKDDSEAWLEEQRKYFGIEAEEYAAGLERMKAYTEEYYAAGIIDYRAYHEAMTDINHQMWDEVADAYDDALQKLSEHISDLREKFSDEEQALRDSWDTDDRAVDMADVARQLEIYKGAVTDRGQQKYKDLQEQMKQLQRDEEMYQLQTRNNAVLEDLEAEYDRMEAAKADVLKQVVTTNIDISDFVGRMNDTISSSGRNIEGLLSQLLTAFKNFSIEAPTYSNNAQYYFNSVDKTDLLGLIGRRVG